MRHRYGEVITNASPLVREQFDRRDQFAIAHPQRIKESALAQKLSELAEAAGLRTKYNLRKVNRQQVLGMKYPGQMDSVASIAAHWPIQVY